MNERQVRREIVDVCHRIYAKGWVANHDGNVSVRVGEDRIILTPTSESKGDISEEMLLVVDLSGQKIAGASGKKPFSEINLHLAAYRARPDIRAVVHAHPPTATGFAVAGISLSPPIMPEVVVSLGDEIPTAPFAMPSTKASEVALVECVERCDAFLLANHGAFTVGATAYQAFLRMELVEHYAKINLVALTLGGAKTLSREDVSALLEKRKKAGLGPPTLPAQMAHLSKRGEAGKSSREMEEEALKAMISREIARVLQKKDS